MSSAADPAITLGKFQRAIEMGLLTLLPGELHPDLSMTVDQPNGTYRYTYARLDGQTVQSIVFFVAVRSIEGFGRHLCHNGSYPFRCRTILPRLCG